MLEAREALNVCFGGDTQGVVKYFWERSAPARLYPMQRQQKEDSQPPNNTSDFADSARLKYVMPPQPITTTSYRKTYWEANNNKEPEVQTEYLSRDGKVDVQRPVNIYHRHLDRAPFDRSYNMLPLTKCFENWVA